jgi:Cu/Ag efflux pump CusA
MISGLVSASLRFRGLLLGLAVVLTVGGVMTLRDAPVDVYPEFTPPYVEIQTESLGLSAAEVEEFLTVPVEADLLNGIEGVEVLRSKSTAGLSSIVLVFEQGYDVYKGRQLVQERLTQLNGAAFPHVSRPPVVLPPLSSSSRVMMIGLSSDKLTPIQKSVIARWTVKPKLLGIQGVSDVNVWGMRDQQLQVQVDPNKLRDKHVSLSQVVATAGNAQVASPISYLEASVPGTGGFLETPSQRLPIRNVFDNIASPETLGQVPIEDTDGKLRLSDVSNVIEEHQPLIGDAVVGDGEGLLLVVEKFPGADTRDITKQIEEKLEDLGPGLGGMTVDTSVFRPATLIDHAVDNTLMALGLGLLLALLVLGALVRSWRRVVVSAVAIVVSLVVGAAALVLLGQTLNTMSVAGLALALCLLVDDAVAGVDALLNRGSGQDSSVTIRDVVRETRRPLAYATVIGAVAIVPLMVMEGRPGAFYAPLGVAYLTALIVGMLVSLLLTPALISMFPPRDARAAKGNVFTRWHDKVLTKALARGNVVIAAAAAAVVVAVVVTPLLSSSVVPSIQDRNVLVRVETPAGTSNTKTTAIATALSKQLRAVDGVDNVVGAVGRAITGDRIVDVNSGELIVSIDRDADYDATIAHIQRLADKIPNGASTVTSYTDQRIRDVGGVTRGENLARGGGLDVMTGVDRAITVRVYGSNLAELKKQALRVQQLVSEVDGVATPTLEQPKEQPTMEIEVDLDKAAEYGLKPGDVRRSEAVMLQGILVGSVFKDQKVFDVIVKGDPTITQSEDSLRNLLIDAEDGSTVRLSQVADVRSGSTPTVIDRDAVSRKLDVTADVEGRSVEQVADELEKRLRALKMPEEYHAEVLDRTVDEEINFGNIAVAGLGSLIAALLLFQALFRTWRLSIGAVLAVGASTFGGVVAGLVLADGLTVGVGAGLLAIAALAARHVAVILRHLQDLELGGRDFGVPLVKGGVTDQRAYVVTSVLTTAALLLPAAVLGPRLGLEILSPLAVTVLAGLVSLTAVDLIVVPVMYRFVRTRDGRAPRPPDDLDVRPVRAGSV